MWLGHHETFMLASNQLTSTGAKIHRKTFVVQAKTAKIGPRMFCTQPFKGYHT